MRYKYEKAKFDDIPDPFKKRKDGVTALLAGTVLAGGAVVVYGGLVLLAVMAVGSGGDLGGRGIGGGGGGGHGCHGGGGHGGDIYIFPDNNFGPGGGSSASRRTSEDLGDRSRILKYEPLSNGLKKIGKGGAKFLLGAHNEKVRQTKYLETHDEQSYHRELAEQKEKNKILKAISKKTIGCIKAKHNSLSRYYDSESLDTIIRNTVKESRVDVLSLRQGTALSAFSEDLAGKLVAQSPQVPANSHGTIKWLDPDLSTDRSKLSKKEIARSEQAQRIVSVVAGQLGGARYQTAHSSSWSVPDQSESWSKYPSPQQPSYRSPPSSQVYGRTVQDRYVPYEKSIYR